MIHTFAHIVAKSPPAIAMLLGGIGLLGGIAGAGWLLLIGVGLQVAWLLL